MRLPFIPYSRVNKILCLVLLSMVFAFLMVGGGYTLLGDPDMGLLLCVPAAIAACFCLLYGILWGVYAHKEKKHQRKLEEVAKLFSEPDDSAVTYHEFILPRKELIHASKNRLQRIAFALLVSGIVQFVIMYGIMYLSNGYGGIRHLISVMGFAFVVVTPGILMQYIVFRKYARAVPERIMLFPGKIIVDGLQYCTYEIKSITVSSIRSVSKDTSVLYRKLKIYTKKQVREYTIDYRFAVDDNPRWSGYGEFLMALRSWAEQNRVKLTVDYMN